MPVTLRTRTGLELAFEQELGKFRAEIARREVQALEDAHRIADQQVKETLREKITEALTLRRTSPMYRELCQFVRDVETAMHMPLSPLPGPKRGVSRVMSARGLAVAAQQVKEK